MEFTSRFEYDSEYYSQPRLVSNQTKDGINSRLAAVTMPEGMLRMAEIIRPQGKGPFAAALFVHWYEPEACNSNRKQFQEEAYQLAQQGVVCMLVETMWSDPDWFLKRTQFEDEENTINQVIELSVFSDLLLQEDGVDPERFVFIGHDFGAMYGVLLGRVDTRPQYYVFTAGTPRFGDWYLYYPKLEGADRERYLDLMREYDPIEHIHSLAPAPVFMQFAKTDAHVPVERAEAFFAAAQQPKQIAWYDCGHEMNEEARIERLTWISTQLGL